MRRTKLVSQGSINRLLQAANEAWNQKNFSEAIDSLERASRLDPANSGLLLDLGRMYGKRYDNDAAERCFEKAVRLASDQTRILAIAGQQSQDFGNLIMAERFFLRSLEQKNSPEVLIQLAKIYERTRRLDQARENVERALRLNPHHPEALLTRSRLERHAGQLETAEEILRSFIAKPVSDVWVHAQTWYELGQILDRQGRYEDAISAILQAKSLLQPQSGRFLRELKIVRQRIQLLYSGLNGEMLKRWLTEAPALQPARRIALLGGHPRSGTTLLEQMLDSHPDITSLEETEIFYDDAYMPLANRMPEDTSMLACLESAPNDALLRSRAGYFRSAESFLRLPIGNRLVIDKNPSLTFLIPALIRIFPEAKLLVALRDPRDVVLSCFMQPMPLGQGSSAYLTLESTVAEYGTMMNLWLSLKPLIESHYLEVRYEDMVEGLEPVARKALEFLGVPWDAKVLEFDEHARKKLVRSPTYADVTQPVYKRAKGRWHNYQKYLEPHLATLKPFVKSLGYAG